MQSTGIDILGKLSQNPPIRQFPRMLIIDERKSPRASGMILFHCASNLTGC